MVLVGLPVRWCCNLERGGQLERVQHAPHFIEAATGSHRIDQDQANSLPSVPFRVLMTLNDQPQRQWAASRNPAGDGRARTSRTVPSLAAHP